MIGFRWLVSQDPEEREAFVWAWTLTVLAGTILGMTIALGRYGTLGLTP